MDFSFLDRDEYNGIYINHINYNNNILPFSIIRMDTCNQVLHRHEFVQIVYMCKGKLKHVLNKNVFDIYKGDITVIPPYVPHYFINNADEKFELIELEFIPEFINEKFSVNYMDCSFIDFAFLEPFLVVENEVRPRLNLKGSLQRDIESILGEILREYEIQDVDFQLLIKTLLQKLLILVGREFRKSIEGTDSQNLFNRHRDALFDAITFINDNCTSEISSYDTAKVALLSPSYFRCIFKQMMKKTFTEYVNGLRINKSIELLTAKCDMKIVDISCEVGFNNVNHFNRIFRQITGVTPKVFRKAAGMMNFSHLSDDRPT